ncbi:diguanylate cyclase domain-containing protein [Paenibacillus sp. EC2-1]|uniref:diguanylate cyclase domain-containing protein n=1 Tax=Paenibacillus sp. EC2-1 TaxID=3388665 RepID=UPI003BEEF2FB
MKWIQEIRTPLQLAVLYLFIQWIFIICLPSAVTIHTLFVIIAPLIASCYLARVASRHEGKLRVFWLLIMMALICEGFAQFAWALPLWIRGEGYGFNVAELLWISEAVFYTAGLVYLFRHEQGVLRGLRFLFDIMIIFIVLMSISWEYILKPWLLDDHYTGDGSMLWMDLAYPVFGMILIFFTIVLYSNAKQVRREVAAFLCLGGGAFVLGNLIYLVNVNLMGQASSPYLNLFWTSAVFLISFAGSHSIPRLWTARPFKERISATRAFFVKYLLPYVVLVSLLILTFDRFGGWGGLFTGLSLSILLIIVRQVLIQLENDRLLERLHDSLRHSEYLAHHDDLTGLYNRRYFNARLIEGIADADRHGNKLGLLYMDLNQFKLINDNYGHRAGDMLIQMVAERLGSLNSERLVSSRLGGDEFTVIVYPPVDDKELMELADRISDLLSRPYKLDEYEIHTGSSIGLAIYPDHASDDQELIGRADAAMYTAKENGLGWQFYTESLQSPHS